MRHRIRFAWAVAAALGAASPAQAFYWDGWPGSSLPRPRTLIPESPRIPPIPTANPTFPPGGEPPIPIPGGPPEVPNPEHVPEPVSAVAAIVGLGVLAARRRLRRA